eukprot:4047536-Amphidinium_carterae.1
MLKTYFSATHRTHEEKQANLLRKTHCCASHWTAAPSRKHITIATCCIQSRGHSSPWVAKLLTPRAMLRTILGNLFTMVRTCACAMPCSNEAAMWYNAICRDWRCNRLLCLAERRFGM